VRLDFEFQGTTAVQRVQKCREIADAAKKLSVAAEKQELRMTYQDLARQWLALAEAIAAESHIASDLRA
jgi:hypothetical protein